MALHIIQLRRHLTTIKKRQHTLYIIGMLYAITKKHYQTFQYILYKEFTIGFFGKLITDRDKKNSKNSDKRIVGYVQSCENLYNLGVSMFPDKDHHEHLVIVLCTIWTRSGVYKEEEIDKPTQSREIVTYTLFPHRE